MVLLKAILVVVILGEFLLLQCFGCLTRTARKDCTINVEGSSDLEGNTQVTVSFVKRFRRRRALEPSSDHSNIVEKWTTNIWSQCDKDNDTLLTFEELTNQDCVEISVDQNSTNPLPPLDVFNRLDDDGDGRLSLSDVSDVTLEECIGVCDDSTDCTDPDWPYCEDGICHQCLSDSHCTTTNKPLCKQGDSVKVCGDPHIQQNIQGSDLNFCYDFYGQPGKTYLFLKDRGLEIQSTFDHEQADRGRYIIKLTIIRGSGQISVTYDGIIVKKKNGKLMRYFWENKSVKIEGGLLQIDRDDKSLKVILGEGDITIDVVRVSHHHHRYLNYGIRERLGLSRDADGIMGSISNHAKLEGSNKTGYIIIWLNHSISVYKKNNCLHVNKASKKDFFELLNGFEM